jgi:hypothetical protein
MQKIEFLCQTFKTTKLKKIKIKNPDVNQDAKILCIL